MNEPHQGDAYLLRRCIGSGGMGVVYEAWDARLERVVALKVLHPHLLTDEKNAARLEREARLAARIAHPHVVHVNRIDRVEGQLVIDMQFIEGTSLHELLRSGPLPLDAALKLLRQVLCALDACHRQGVLHLDLKPANLLVTPEGHVYLTDFGIARAALEHQAASGLDSGPLWGTPRYSPPEAWRGETPTQSWDLYAAGVLVREALLGHAEVAAATPELQMRHKLDGAPADIALVLPGISSELAGLLNALVAQQPQDRPASAAAALSLLECAPEFREQDAPTEQLRLSPPRGDSSHGFRGQGGRRPRNLAVVTVVVVSMLALAGWWTFRSALKTGAPTTGAATSARGVIDSLTVTGSAAYFAYDDGVHGRELWNLSSYHPAPQLVADIASGAASSNPRRLIGTASETLYFAASSPETGEELWACNLGFQAIPEHRLVKDILPGPMSSEPLPVASHENQVLLYATTLPHGRELWCSAGQGAQTGPLPELAPGVHNSQPMDPRILPAGHRAYVVAYGGDGLGMHLWRYEFGANAVMDIARVDESAGAMVVVGNVLLFSNRDRLHGLELWRHEVDSTEIELLSDLWPGPDSSEPGQYSACGDFALFHARTLETGLELWRTDGTALGTELLADIHPGREGSDPNAFVRVGGLIYFRADDGQHGRELWVTDGTAAGTRLAADVWPGAAASTPYNITAQGGMLYFSADDGVHGEELWSLDTADAQAAPQLVSDICPGAASSEPHGLRWLDPGKGIFIAGLKEVHHLFQLDTSKSPAKVERVPLPGQASAGEAP